DEQVPELRLEVAPQQVLVALTGPRLERPIGQPLVGKLAERWRRQPLGQLRPPPRGHPVVTARQRALVDQPRFSVSLRSKGVRSSVPPQIRTGVARLPPLRRQPPQCPEASSRCH